MRRTYRATLHYLNAFKAAGDQRETRNAVLGER